MLHNWRKSGRKPVCGHSSRFRTSGNPTGLRQSGWQSHVLRRKIDAARLVGGFWSIPELWNEKCNVKSILGRYSRRCIRRKTDHSLMPVEECTYKIEWNLW